MIAIDSSSFRRFLDGERSAPDVVLVRAALRDKQGYLPPVAITELLSEPTLGDESRSIVFGASILPLPPGHWIRAGELRGRLLRSGKKAKLPDCLIAQACIDNDAPLITYDRDFRHFESAGLKLL